MMLVLILFLLTPCVLAGSASMDSRDSGSRFPCRSLKSTHSEVRATGSDLEQIPGGRAKCVVVKVDLTKPLICVSGNKQQPSPAIREYTASALSSSSQSARARHWTEGRTGGGGPRLPLVFPLRPGWLISAWFSENWMWGCACHIPSVTLHYGIREAL